MESLDKSTNHGETRKRIARLRAMLARHDRLYYIENQPEISDREYDRLYRELTDLEQKHPELITPDSPSQRVGGAPLAGFKPVRHRHPMLSLSNTYSQNELLEFYARTRRLLPGADFTTVVEPKIDGVAVSLRYEDGVLTIGSSRGNGIAGDDITANLRTIRVIPLRLTVDAPPSVLEVRGEVYMPRNGFVELNRVRTAAGELPFANPRNAAAGSLKLLDSRQVAGRPLAAIFYGTGELKGIDFNTHIELLEYLKTAGLQIPPRYWLCADEDDLARALADLREKRRQFPFETDGAVLKVNQRQLYERLGVTAKSPRWAVAFKFEPERAFTRLRDITVQVGRTGVLTPVAELEPVALAGSTINRATLHNADEIQKRDIRIGDLVAVEKAGDVIPVVTAVDVKARTGTERKFSMPNKCPVCGGLVSRVDDEIAWRCEDLQCPAQVKRWIMHFASRNAMDIENLGEALVDQLVDKKLVAGPADLYGLTAQALTGLERMGIKSAENIIAGIAASRRRPFANLIFALGIRHVGQGLARVLEQCFEDIDALASAGEEELMNIRDVGPVAARSIVAYFNAPRTGELLRKLASAGVNLRRLADSYADDRHFAGRTFVLTGTMAGMTRTQAEKEIRRRGGHVASSVSRKTSFVVAGDEPGSKHARALKLGVPILSENDFRTLLKRPAGNTASDDALSDAVTEKENNGDVRPGSVNVPQIENRPGELPLW